LRSAGEPILATVTTLASFSALLNGRAIMDQPHQGKKPPKPARVGGPHSGRRKPDFDDTGEQLREHRQRQSPSLEEAARRVEERVGKAPHPDRDARVPRLEVRDGNDATAMLERECSDEYGLERHVQWHVCYGGEFILEAEPSFETALDVFSDACDF
jgi:hypothetical protein